MAYQLVVKFFAGNVRPPVIGEVIYPPVRPESIDECRDTMNVLARNLDRQGRFGIVEALRVDVRDPELPPNLNSVFNAT